MIPDQLKGIAVLRGAVLGKLQASAAPGFDTRGTDFGCQGGRS